MNTNMLVSLLYLLLLLLLSCILVETNGCHDHERAALLTFKSHLHDPSDRLASWQGLNCCNWYGIGCSASLHVVALDLHNPYPSSFIINMNSQLLPIYTSSSTITGTISSSLFTLAHITYLDLSFNNFNFSKIPTGLANLTQLTYLNLSNAMFSDHITTQFANLTCLKWLDLSSSFMVLDYASITFNVSSTVRMYVGAPYTHIYGANLSSSSLDWLRGLRGLVGARLTGVDLSKASQLTHWAEPISSLSNLRLFHMSNCRIHATIPTKSLVNLTLLTSLEMGFNTLNSQIPYELANLTSLLILDFTRSKLQGSIPYIPQLKRLHVGSNIDLNINLKSMFAVPWVQLQSLDIQSTKVRGSIPASLANTTSLLHFIAYNSSIEGRIPSAITNLSSLELLLLDYNNIVGQIPPSVSKLKRLKSLTFIQNSLEGSIPDSVCSISSLQYLHLARNSLTGRLPDCISQLHDLRSLMVTSNKLTGTIPSLRLLFQNAAPDIISLGYNDLTVKLDQYPFPPSFQPQFLDLNSCHLEGSIPDFISNLTQLSSLHLANNNLSGAIPSWLFKLPRLGFLDLSFNSLQGVLPRNILLHSYFGPTALILANNHLQGSIPGVLENVEVMDLSSNNFTGYIPAEMKLGNLRYVALSGNKLFGPIPLTFCETTNVLMLLDLSYNSLSETIPRSLGNCTSLIFLNLAGNNLSGSVPDEVTGAKELTYLNLNDNHLDGPFPVVIPRLQNLAVLDLGRNKFEGKIPKLIGELYNLHILVLGWNSFNDTIPEEINKLEKLQFLDFSNNKLSGSIPKRLNGLNMLRTRPKDGTILAYFISFIYARVEINMASKGSSYQLDVVRSYHSGMDLSCNALTGTIPSEVGLLQGLYMLNLSHNSLSGNIPSSIGNMTGLESLDLSFNHISGEIPITLTLLDSLSFLNLSYNNLSGEVPRGLHFDTLNNDGAAYFGNMLLCGAAVEMSCSNNGSSSESVGDQEEDAWDDDFLFYGIVICGYAVGICGFFGVLYLINERWRERYWNAIDKIASKIFKTIRY